MYTKKSEIPTSTLASLRTKTYTPKNRADINSLIVTEPRAAVTNLDGLLLVVSTTYLYRNAVSIANETINIKTTHGKLR